MPSRIDLDDIRILIYLLMHGQATKAELVKSLGISWSSLSSRLEKLIELELVRKTLLIASPPRYVYTLTRKGVELLMKLFEDLKKAIEEGRFK